MPDSKLLEKQVQITLPTRAYEYLGKWIAVLPNSEPREGFWKSFYTKINTEDDSDLTVREKLALDNLLTANPLTRSNLYQFVDNYKVITVVDNLWSKIRALYYKYKDSKFNKEFDALIDTEEDTWLLEDRVKRFELSEGLYDKLDKFDFAAADNVVADNADAINDKLYLKMKASYFAKYYEQKYQLFQQPFLLDKNQSEALLSDDKYTLVQGRAATGKTQLLLAKALYLNEQLGIKPEEMLLLSFDNVLTENLEFMLTQAVTDSETSKALFKKTPAITLAKLIELNVATKEKLLLSPEKVIFIENVLDGLWEGDKSFRDGVYEFLRSADSYVDKKELKDLEAYYKYNIDLRYQSLKGEKLSSLGEKWVADFLFERGINYLPEYQFDLTTVKTEDANLIKFQKEIENSVDVDFYLPDTKLLIEYWSIDENEKDISNKIEFDKIFGLPWLTYQRLMQEKKLFWLEYRHKILNPEAAELVNLANATSLIELSLFDLKLGRESFEQKLEELLTAANVSCEKLSADDIYEKTWQQNKSRLTKLFISYIERGQQNYYDNDKILVEKIEAYKNNQRIYNFLKLGQQVHESYLNQLQLPIKKRFSNIQNLPKVNLDSNQVLASLVKAMPDSKIIKDLKKIKWVLIDGLQDFSLLYQGFINALLELNPDLKIFAVGDLWQACRQYAGADELFIKNFINTFAEVNTMPLITNFRSNRKLVVAGNHFMQDNEFRGGSAQVFNTNNDNSVFITNVSETDGSSITEKYINKTVEIIKNDNSKSYLLVHPKLASQNFTLTDFYNSLVEKLLTEKIFKDEDEIRQYIFADNPENLAGIAVDYVIMLEVVQDVYPTVSVDNELFEVFGSNVIIEDIIQKQYFYLAITRARESLWLLTEAGNESEYLESFT